MINFPYSQDIQVDCNSPDKMIRNHKTSTRISLINSRQMLKSNGYFREILSRMNISDNFPKSDIKQPPNNNPIQASHTIPNSQHPNRVNPPTPTNLCTLFPVNPASEQCSRPKLPIQFTTSTKKFGYRDFIGQSDLKVNRNGFAFTAFDTSNGESSRIEEEEN